MIITDTAPRSCVCPNNCEWAPADPANLCRMNRYLTVPPDSLSRRARSFVSIHGIRLDPRPLEEHRGFWLERGIPAKQIDRMIAFEERWGGFALAPAPAYEGGPRLFGADSPEGSPEEGWWFSAGDQRCSVPFSFWIGPNDEFGIYGPIWTPLHSSIEGWVESVALAHHAALWAKTITKLHGADVDALDLSRFEQVPEVRGLADTWWKHPGSYIAIFHGESRANVSTRTAAAKRAFIYEGLPAWA